jgi:outer membrane protein assembly factor BamD
MIKVINWQGISLKFCSKLSKRSKSRRGSIYVCICYYEGSMDYNLDQSSTELAINELQDFLTNYPNSERSKISPSLLTNSYKLEFKAYENGRQYFKMGEYKAANVALENVLEDFQVQNFVRKFMIIS